MDEIAKMRRKKQIEMIANLFEANFLYHEGLLMERDYQDAKENAEHVLMETAFMTKEERDSIRIEGYRQAKATIDKLIK